MKHTLSKLALALALVIGSVTTAHAVQSIDPGRLLGTVVPGTPANPENEVEMVRFLVAAYNAGQAIAGQGVNLGSNPADPQNEAYTLYSPTGLATPAPLPLVPSTYSSTATSNTTLNLTGQYEYIVAKFGQDSVVLYIGGLVGEFTIPNLTGNGNGLSHYTLVDAGPTPTGVPDGGATVALLGLALTGIGAARRYLIKV